MKELRAQIKACGKCEGMNIRGVTQAVPGWGSVHSPVVLVGQSLCHECMESQKRRSPIPVWVMMYRGGSNDCGSAGGGFGVTEKSG